MPERQLVRLFLQRLLDHDLVSPHADRREVLSLTVGALVAVSLFLAVVLSIKYQFHQFMPPGLTAVLSLDDRLLFVSLSMIVLALVAVAEWDALTLDPRDTAVLGALPLPRASIVRAKFVAALVFGGGFAVALNLAPTVLRAAALPQRLPVTMADVLWLTIGHGLATLMAGVFGFLAVLSLREWLHAGLGSRHFARVSAWLQVLLVVFLVTVLLLLPSSKGGASRWLADEGVGTLAHPVAWFVGMHESVAGSVIDILPRRAPPRSQADAERVATAEYQRLRPRIRVLARAAVGALIVVTLVAVAGCAWNGRRWPLPAVPDSRRWCAFGRASRWLVVHAIARRPEVHAGFSFTLHTLFRQVSHRTTLAVSTALGMALVILMARAGQSTSMGDLAAAPATVLAAQTVWLAAVLCGLRQAVRLPAHLSGTTTFQLAWSGDTEPYVTGVKRACWLALVLPSLAIVAVVHITLLGLAGAAWHGLVGIAVAAVLMEGLFFTYRGLPFASGYIPSDTVKAGSVFLAVMVIVTALGLAWLERVAISTSTGTATLIGLLVASSVALNAGRARRLRNREPLDLDDRPDEPTLRLDLSC